MTPASLLRGIALTAAVGLPLALAGPAAGAPADIPAVTKFVEAHEDKRNPTREYKLLRRPRGRVLGRCISRTYTGTGYFRVNCKLADGSIFTRGKVQLISDYRGYNRITGGTGAYSGASGRFYREVGNGYRDVYFDFPPLDPAKPEQFDPS